ncbi:MAG: hypothetical protein RQ968_05605 [Thermoproteota archaeon]|jgi:hypothetical protein|nr:hypothetical protein [Thermoproteota archaeon]
MSRKKIVAEIVILLLLLSYFPILKAHSETTLTQQVTTQYTTSVSGVNFKISYNWTVEVDPHKKDFNAGETGNVIVGISGGKARITLNINVPLIGELKFDTGTFDYEAGSVKSFNLTPSLAPVQATLSLKIKNIVFTNISVEGPASISPKNLVWEKPESKEFQLSINTNARGGDAVKLKFPFQVKFVASVNVSIAGFPFQPFEQELGKAQANPEIVYEVKVAATGFDWLIILAILAVVAVLIAIVAWFFVRKRKK